MVFAAGRGTRMAPLTDAKPKPLIEVAGKALIDHALDLADGIETIVVNTHYLAEQIETHLKGRSLVIVHEATLLETGGGLKNSWPLLGPGPVLRLNSDAVWRGSNLLHDLIDAWNGTTMDALVSVVSPERAFGHKGSGDFLRDGTGRLSRGPGYIYTGAQILRTARVCSITDTVFSMNRVWDAMIASRTLYGQPYSGIWCDVGQPESINLAETMLNVRD